MINLNTLYSDQRTINESNTKNKDYRTAFQRDYDRIIFSSAFRRLQNKTQVFPLPRTVFVHNRLTHSLEAASVGRSLGYLIGQYIATKYKNDIDKDSKYFFKHNLSHVIASATLCHDIGNPAFGHSGEDAVSEYFIKNESCIKPLITDKQWLDLINFEGNANAIRVLTQTQNGKSKGGLLLTFSTLSAIAKYPCESQAIDKKILSQKKFGFFQSEKEIFVHMANQTGMKQKQSNPICYLRHPFVWLTEAADDICYNIIDFEDAHRLKIVDHHTCLSLLKNIVVELGDVNPKILEEKLNTITDQNDKISYLRAKSIGTLTKLVYDKYLLHLEQILSGDFNTSLFDLIANKSSALQQIRNYSREHIYKHRSVIEIEHAGYQVIGTLLNFFIPIVIKEPNQLSNAEKLTLSLLPEAYKYENREIYYRILGIIDYISGMTDDYAVELYRKMTGIEIGMKF